MHVVKYSLRVRPYARVITLEVDVCHLSATIPRRSEDQLDSVLASAGDE